MPEVQEVFRMATQNVRPDPGALERQNREQRRRSTRRKAGVYGLVATFVILAGVVAAGSLRSGDDGTVIPGSAATSSATPIPSLPFGALEPGTYVVSTLDPGFDASHRITISVPSGWEGFGESAVLNFGSGPYPDMAVGAGIVENTYAKPCRWESTALDPPLGPQVDDLVAALANQQGRDATTPTDVTLDGYAGKYMELTTPVEHSFRESPIDPANCDGGEFRSWLYTDGGSKYTQPGQHELLWILDVDGVRLVIDAKYSPGNSAQDRAELLQIVESIRIDPL
jgi:hypothetical protein